MFNFFKKKKIEEATELIIPAELLIPALNDDQIQLSQSELNEIDDLISSIKITIEEVEKDLEELTADTTFHIHDPDDVDALPEDKKKMLDIVKKGLNNVMDEFLSQQKQQLIDKLNRFKTKLAIWQSFRSKIDSHLRLTIDNDSISDSILPLNIFMSKVMKTIESNPTLLTESQSQKIKDYIDSVMKEAFNS